MQTMLAQTAKFKSVSSLAGVLVLLGSGVCLCKAPDPESALGELRLEGRYIERLVLKCNDGHTEALNDPEETLKLPAGQYILQNVRLKGGYTHQTTPDNPNRVTISKDSPALLKVGGPLNQTISIRRKGRILELTYALVGVGGETYVTTANQDRRPTFAVYKGDREIAAGEFEFG